MLRRAEPRARLLEAAAGCERLVLLGDVIEFRHGPLSEALDAAEPVLEEIAAALGAGRQVLLVPGNHDHRLLREWLGRRAADAAPPPLGLEAAVEWRDDEPLARIVRALEPAAVSVSYPGAWLREDVYAIHGHYCDRHSTVPILERLGSGLMARLIPEPDGGPAQAEDYEATLGPMYDWIDAVAERGGFAGARGGSVQVRAWRGLQPGRRRRRLRGRAVRLGFLAFVFALNRAGMGPLRADISGAELRRSGLRATAEALGRLGVDAPHVIFGHTHRAGPLAGDDRSEWMASAGMALLNAGSWVYERGFLGDDPGRSPYRPGFAAVVPADGPPELVNLLDEH